MGDRQPDQTFETFARSYCIDVGQRQYSREKPHGDNDETETETETFVQRNTDKLAAPFLCRIGPSEFFLIFSTNEFDANKRDKPR